MRRPEKVRLIASCWIYSVRAEQVTGVAADEL